MYSMGREKIEEEKFEGLNIGPSEVRATSGANLGKPLFKVLIFFSFLLLRYLFSQKGLL